MSRYHFTPLASEDFYGILFRIAQDNPDAAWKFHSDVDEKCDILAGMPKMGRVRDDLSRGLRSFPIGDYLIFYREAATGIEVVRLLHGAMDIPAQFS